MKVYSALWFFYIFIGLFVGMVCGISAVLPSITNLVTKTDMLNPIVRFAVYFGNVLFFATQVFYVTTNQHTNKNYKNIILMWHPFVCILSFSWIGIIIGHDSIRHVVPHVSKHETIGVPIAGLIAIGVVSWKSLIIAWNRQECAAKSRTL